MYEAGLCKFVTPVHAGHFDDVLMYEAGFCKFVTPDEPDDQGTDDMHETGFSKVVTPGITSGDEFGACMSQDYVRLYILLYTLRYV